MANTTRDYQSWKLRKLSDPAMAKAYINDILRNSPELFLTALKNVAQALEVSNVAREAGIAREHIYRAFAPSGNPTWDTLASVMRVVGLELDTVRLIGESPNSPASPAPSVVHPARAKAKHGRTTRARRAHLESLGQLCLPLAGGVTRASAKNATTSAIGTSGIGLTWLQRSGTNIAAFDNATRWNQAIELNKGAAPVAAIIHSQQQAADSREYRVN